MLRRGRGITTNTGPIEHCLSRHLSHGVHRSRRRLARFVFTVADRLASRLRDLGVVVEGKVFNLEPINDAAFTRFSLARIESRQICAFRKRD
jgi:hypothetical protein